ncbi:MAG: type II glyceraldehyde-3-phosphate dehydrogenase [Acidilobaceae archaeon]|nr:type II glyceraldehyde-3-phosphate dehydrogenase [Acidilobaceae archaeon]MCX8165643.1 type II glyceraldehyde-3-phosphate dehydrogenase [Acidilobaceae archaeon]MDW7974069.1 type II glyceraldehyde-3-phosphate dehydrogenase [Sulfolobales archaeon]
MRIRVGLNGYGTIGKRVAMAVMKQDDMELVGIVKKSYDYSVEQARAMNMKIYVPSEAEAKSFEAAGVKVEGTLKDLLASVNVIIDATPGGVGAQYKPLYAAARVRQIYQGGEKKDIAQVSFSSLCNYSQALGKESARVVSCNTTGLLRIICGVNSKVGVRRVRAVIVRRGADPREVKRGPINSVELDPPKAPSHHALDVQSVIPVDIVTVAVAIPTTLMHVHHVTLKLERSVTKADVISILESTPRIMLVNSERSGITGTAGIIEAARDVRMRYDVPELVVFEDSIHVDGDEVMLFQAIHQESIVVPENVDAVRALAEIEEDPQRSIAKTDQSLGLNKRLW